MNSINGRDLKRALEPNGDGMVTPTEPEVKLRDENGAKEDRSSICK